MDILTGNAQDADTHGTGWFIGFSDWTRLPGSSLLHVPRGQPLHGLCVKWFAHPDGHGSGDAKPVSEGRTVSLLVGAGGSFRIEFSPSPAFDAGTLRTVRLQRPGDYVAWGAGLYHRWHCERASTVLSLRWSDG